MSRRARDRGLLTGLLRSLRRGLHNLAGVVTLHLLSWRLALSGVALRRRIELLEKRQRLLRGRLVSVTAAAELAGHRGDESNPARSEREALSASLARLGRALCEARAERAGLQGARLAAASSRETERSVASTLRETAPVLGEGLVEDAGPGRFDTPAWEARRRLGASARTRATLAALRAGSPLLEFGEELRDAAEALAEVGGVGEQ